MMGFITKIYTTINNHILFDAEKEQPPVPAQKDYLASLPDPKDDFERSYYKYKCLLYCTYSKKERVIINAICFIALLFLVPFYRIKGIKHDKAMARYQSNDILLRKTSDIIPVVDVFPEKLSTLFAKTIEFKQISYKKIFVTHDAFKYYKKIALMHPLSFHYRMVVLMRISQACYLLNMYNPKAVTTYVCEREFADPLLTQYYESHGVQYHGFMHGDYLFSIQFAFMKLSKYWVWNEHYEEMFHSLRCSFDMEVYLPKKYSGIVKPRASVDSYDYYATYYFSDETKASIELVKEALLKLRDKGLNCKVRPHPRFSDKEAIQIAFVDSFVIEDPLIVPIEESLENSYLTIALVSTVLSQAYYSNKKIVIDDISNPKKYKELFEKGYILADKADYLLSELIG